MESILITGVAGFIGSHLARALLRERFRVGGIERPGADLGRLEEVREDLALYDLDLRDLEAVERAMRAFRPDVLCHLVTHYAVEHKPAEVRSMIETNLAGTAHLLEAARQHTPRLLVNTSSCFVYRPSDAPLREDSPLEPLNLYALTKIQAEQMCDFYGRQYGLRTATLRLFPPYGPRDHDRRLIPQVLRGLRAGEAIPMTSGRQRWDFTYVEDVAEAYVRTIRATLPEGHQVFNIGAGQPVSVREVVEAMQRLTGSSSPLQWGAVPHRENEVWHLCADPSRARSLLDWSPRVPILQGGLERTIQWFLAQRPETHP